MRQADFRRFGVALTALAELHGREVSEAATTLWWEALKGFDIDQVERALRRCVTDPERGQFMPKPADVIRMLDGTRTDRAAIAWGKVHGAISSVGAYTDVVFDDAVIHAVIDDLGGWPKVCRGELADLGYLAHRFCEAYRAYAARVAAGDPIDYPRLLGGDRSSDETYALRGLRAPTPAVVGDIDQARRVYSGGAIGGKLAITHVALVADSAAASLPAPMRRAA